MKIIILLILMGIMIPAQAQIIDDAPVLVIIGQSNAGGSALFHEITIPEKIKAEVAFWEYNNNLNQKTISNFQRIDFSNSQTNIPSRDNGGGLETFWASENLYVIKMAIGGSSYADWLINGIFENSVKPSYNSAINELSSSGKNPKIQGVIIWHGESGISEPNNIEDFESYLLEVKKIFGFDVPLFFVGIQNDTSDYYTNILNDYVKISHPEIIFIDTLQFDADPSRDAEHAKTQVIKAVADFILNYLRTNDKQTNTFESFEVYQTGLVIGSITDVIEFPVANTNDIISFNFKVNIEETQGTPNIVRYGNLYITANGIRINDTNNILYWNNSINNADVAVKISDIDESYKKIDGWINGAHVIDGQLINDFVPDDMIILGAYAQGNPNGIKGVFDRFAYSPGDIPENMIKYFD